MQRSLQHSHVKLSTVSVLSVSVRLAGEGRVHQCLRDNREKLSEACRREETKLQIIESSNTELMPNLARACKVRA